MKILAIDLGKVKGVACDYQSETAAHRFETVRTEPAILEDLFRRHRPDRIVIEVGPAAGKKRCQDDLFYEICKPRPFA